MKINLGKEPEFSWESRRMDNRIAEMHFLLQDRPQQLYK